MNTILKKVSRRSSLALLLSCFTTFAGDNVLSSFEFPGAKITMPGSITPDGRIAGDYVNPDGSQHGFLLSDGNYQTIDVPDGTQTTVTWINPRGQMVGSYTGKDGRSHGFLLNGGRFTTIDYPSAIATTPLGSGITGTL